MSNYGAAFSMRYGLTLGLTAMEGRGFSNPVDLAISGDDRLYVLSRTNPVQTEGIRVGILNLDSDYFGDFGSYGSGDGSSSDRPPWRSTARTVFISPTSTISVSPCSTSRAGT